MLTEVYGVGFSHGFHRIHRNDCRRIFSHGFHGFPQMVRLRYWQRGYGRMPYPPNLCTSVQSVGGTSLPEFSVCSVYSVGHSLPVCLFMSVVVFSHGIHRMLGCVIGGVGMAGMPYPPNLCASVSICGRLSLPEGSVCSVYSVGHSLCLLCWCCRGSCTSVVVFSHGIHGFPQMVRLRYWRRGYGRDAIPS